MGMAKRMMEDGTAGVVIEKLKDKVEKEQIVKAGVMNIAGSYYSRKKEAENTMQKLFNIIVKHGSEEALREAYKATSHKVVVKYFSEKGEVVRKNKKGEEYTLSCYVSAWGKYAGSIYNKFYPPVCNAYVPYVNDEDFEFDKETNKFLWVHDSVMVNGKLRECAHILTKAIL